MRVLGIDEAGRGCVFGPLVVAGFAFEGPDDGVLTHAGAGDSKAMSAARREQARTALDGMGRWQIRAVEAGDIDEGNLNTLEETAIVSLVRALEPDRVVVDALGPPAAIPHVVARLSAATGLSTSCWTMEPKADANHPVVGAASIFAKTTRDARLDGLRGPWGELGSGYPSDPKVRKWIVDWAARGEPWPPFVRTRWSTVATLASPRLFD